MLSTVKFVCTFWLLLISQACSSSAHDYGGYRYKFDETQPSHDQIINVHTSQKPKFAFNDKQSLFYSPDDAVASDIRNHNFVTSAATSPPVATSKFSGAPQHNGWTPIIRSQTTSKEHKRYAEARIRNAGVDGAKRERTVSPRQSRNTFQSTLHFRPAYQRQQQQQQSQFQFYGNGYEREFTSTKPSPVEYDLRRHYPQKKGKITLNENDIMWLHYGPEPTIRNHYQKIGHKNKWTSDQTLPKDKLRRSYLVEESDTGDDITVPPRNIYEMIDWNRPTRQKNDTVVAALSKRQTNADTRQTDEPSSENVIQTYKFDFNDILNKPVIDYNDSQTSEDSSMQNKYDDVESHNEVDPSAELAKPKLPNRNIGDFEVAASVANSAKGQRFEIDSSIVTNHTADYSVLQVSSSSSKPFKSGRLLSKPIIIMDQETTTLTPEYYRQLFDSFSRGHYRHMPPDSFTSNQKNLFLSKKKWSSSSSTVRAIAANSIATTSSILKDEDVEISTTKQHYKELDPKNETEKSDSLFFSIPKHQLKDLVPKTLRTNLMAIKRVLIDCSTSVNGSKHQSSSVICLKKITFNILDKAIVSDVVKLTDAVSLIRENITNVGQKRSATFENGGETEWLPNIIEKIQTLFSTHALKVKLINSQEFGSLQVEGRRRHYRKVFPIMVGAYMILSSLLIPLGFKFMAVLGTKSILLSSLSLMTALMGGFKKYMGGNNNPQPPSYYPSPYPAFYPSIYDPWRRDEYAYRKISSGHDDPMEFSHFTEEVE